MLYSIKNRDDLEKSPKLASLQNQGKAVRLQDKLGKKFHEELKKVFEPVTETITKTSEDLTKTLMLTSKGNNKALETLNNKLLQLINDKCIMVSYLFFLNLKKPTLKMLAKLN